jgi:hypothetical protein
MPLRYKHSRRPEIRAEVSVRVAQWVRERIGDDEGVAVGVSGNECGHAACGGNDTIILLMRAGEPPVRVKIAKSIEMVTQAEVADALASAKLPWTVVAT